MSTEQEMRDTTVPTFHSLEELKDYIDGLVKQQHDYGTCVYAMSMAATAAFNYVASQLGVTGFQASCADLDVLRRTRHIEGPFIFMQLRDLLYPQYNLHEKLNEFIASGQDWLKEEAAKQLAKHVQEGDLAHPNVVAHWRKLALGYATQS